MMIEHIDISKPVLFMVENNKIEGRVAEVLLGDIDNKTIFKVELQITSNSRDTVLFSVNIDDVWNEGE